MSNNNTDKGKSNVIEQAAILSASGAGEPSSAQEALARLLAIKLGKEQAEEAAEDARKKQFQEAQLAAIHQQMKQTAQNQEYCGHLKENYRSALGGQKDSKGNLHMICQFCFKEFGNDFPQHLRIPAEMIGGPQ